VQAFEFQAESMRTLARVRHVRHEDYLDKRISQPSCGLVIEAPVIRVMAGLVLEKPKRLKAVPAEGPDRVIAVIKNWKERTTYGWCIPDEAGVLPAAVGYIHPGEPGALAFLAVCSRDLEGALVGAWCIVITPVDESLGIYRRIGLGYMRDMECIEAASAAPENITLA
jgi:hypothetical protein